MIRFSLLYSLNGGIKQGNFSLRTSVSVKNVQDNFFKMVNKLKKLLFEIEAMRLLIRLEATWDP